MTIVIKASELNAIIYKYLLEAGLQHTAYSLYNEANLQQPLQQFRFDIKAGHLLSLLERSLIYSQIQSHVTLSDYQQCQQPYHLLKSHICKITQKSRKQKEQLVKQMTNQINEGIKRTNSIYSSCIANREYDEIIYDSKGTRYLDKFSKIKLGEQSHKFMIEGSSAGTLLYDKNEHSLSLLKDNALTESITLSRVFPCLSNGKLEQLLIFNLAHDYVIQVFGNNQITLFNNNQDDLTPLEFQLDIKDSIQSIKVNPDLPYLAAFTTSQTYQIINLNNFSLLPQQKGKFYWKMFDEYIHIDEHGTVSLKSLMKQQPLITFSVGNLEAQDAQFNSQKNLIALWSTFQKLIHVYTFENTQPLFVFNLEDDKTLRQVIWTNSRSVEYLCWLTNSHIKVFDIALNNFSKILQIDQYDSFIWQLLSIQKSNQQTYLLAQGNEHLIVYDISNSKLQRIQIENQATLIKSLTPSKTVLVTENSLYFLQGNLLEPLFK